MYLYSNSGYGVVETVFVVYDISGYYISYLFELKGAKESYFMK